MFTDKKVECVLIYNFFLFCRTVGNDCKIRIVKLTLQSETWKSALNNKESVEFKILQAKLTSDVSMLQHFASTSGDHFRARNLFI